MRGTVIKRGRSWAVVVDVGRNPFTGQRVRRWHSGYSTKRDAERARTEVLSRLDHGTYVEPDRRALGPYLEVDWLPAMRASVRASTWDSYARNIRLHIVPALGGVALQALTPARLNEFYAGLLQDGRRDGRGGLAPKTCAICMASFARRFLTPCGGTSCSATSPTRRTRRRCGRAPRR